MARERRQRRARHDVAKPDRARARPHGARGDIDRLHALPTTHAVRRQIVQQRAHVLDRAAGRIAERRVVPTVARAGPHVRDDVGDICVGKEPAHRVDVQAIEVGGVQLLVVRAQELVGDRLAEPADQHVPERRRLALARRAEEQVDQALEELVVRELVDVLLEREVDVAARVADEALLDDRAHVLAGHARAQPRLDRRILEVEEVAGVIPRESVTRDGAAVAARLALGLEHEHRRAGMTLAVPVRVRQPRHARADDDGVVRRHSLSSSVVKIRRVIAIAHPYVLSTPK